MQVTSKAVQKIRELGEKQQPEGFGLRVIVELGGAEGFYYDLDFETAAKPDDQVFEADGLKVYVDKASWERFGEGTIDYVESPEFSGFHFDNPNKPTGPADDAPLATRVQWVLDTEINPGVAGHGGQVQLVDIQDGNVLVRFGGGCHGCSASSATLKYGVEQRLKDKFPEIGEVIDVTDHATGSNPYYQH
jgi:Fe/S biogenesis protein NfuA